MAGGLLVLGLLGLGIIVLNVAILRWVFRVNHIVKTLESIDRSLQFLPAVRAGRTQAAQRKAA
jgi:hypothetical protein